MKTITISDEVYSKLEALKGSKSFTELIDQLIKANVSIRIDRVIELSRYKTGREEELAELVGKVRKEFRARE